MRKQYERARDYSKLTANAKVAETLAAHYNELYNSLVMGSLVSYHGRCMDDIFSDTLMYVIHQEDAPLEEEELLSYFKYKFQMIKYQTIKDAQNLSLIYGYHLQTKKNEG